MITRDAICREVDYHPVELSSGALKFSLSTRRCTQTYYLARDTVNDRDVLTLAEEGADDAFACSLLSAACGIRGGDVSPAKQSLALPDSLFTHGLLVPPSYHRYLGGVLEAERSELFLVLPIFECEFSGDESVDLFAELCRRYVPTLVWSRTGPCPRIMVRSDNPKTGGGTHGNKPVPYSHQIGRAHV